METVAMEMGQFQELVMFLQDLEEEVLMAITLMEVAVVVVAQVQREMVVLRQV